MDYLTIDMQLHKFRMICEHSDYDNNKYAIWGFETISWYVLTDRASLEYMRAFCALTPKQLKTLSRKCAGATTQSVIAISKHYLQCKD